MLVVRGAVVCEAFRLDAGQSLDCYAPLTAPRLSLRVTDVSSVNDDDDGRRQQLLHAATDVVTGDELATLEREAQSDGALIALSSLDASETTVNELFDASRLRVDDNVRLGGLSSGDEVLLRDNVASLFAVR